MDAVTQPAGRRGLGLLEAHLALSDADAPSARERLDAALGPELAHLLVFALCPSSPDRERAATPAAA